MEGFDLGRLNPISFERLVRALCFSKMGPAGTVYSSGPDGGRDFTYDGAIAGYEGKRWEGYLVVQAKFKDPSLSKTNDAEWIKAQLEGELAKYTQAESRLKKPEYYILVTNVRLSGADGSANKSTGRQRKGGMSKVKEFFAPWKTKIKLKDFDIWPHDKIIDLLVSEPLIRQSYAQWITSGDVLAKALQHFAATRADFGEVASRSLKNSLHRDQFVRLKDAGSVSDLQIRTSQVIVDLPLVNPTEDRIVHDLQRGVLYLESEEEEVSFAACVRAFCGRTVGPSFIRMLPWPLATILPEASEKAHLENILAQISDGRRGDIDQWLAAEKRWEAVGIVEADFYVSEEDSWFNEDIARIGLPFLSISYERIRSPSVSLAKKLIEMSKGVENKGLAKMMVDMGASFLLFGPQREEWPESDVPFVLDTAINAGMGYIHGADDVILMVPTSMRSIPDIATKIGILLSYSEQFAVQDPNVRDLVVSSFEADPTLEALWYPASLGLLADETADAGKRLIAALSHMESRKEVSGLYPKTTVSVLRLIECADVEKCVDDILAIGQTSALLSMLLVGETLPVEKRLIVLTVIIKKLHQLNSPAWPEYIPLARKALDARKSDLTNALVWRCKLVFPPESFEVLLPVVTTGG